MTTTEKLARKDKEIQSLREENRLLRQKVDALVRHVFGGGKNEKLSSNQLEMFGDDTPGQSAACVEKTEETQAPKKARQRQPRRPRYPENLPVVEDVIDPEPVKANPSHYRQIGVEVSEQLDYEPGRFFLRKQIRRTWVKRNAPDAVPVTAPLPPKLLDRGVLAPGLLAHIVVGKYADHLPLYRQEQIFKQRYDVHLGRNTLCRAVDLVAGWLQPIARRMFENQLASGYVQLDETPVRYLGETPGKTSKGYLWVCNAPRGDTVFHWATGRGYEHLQRWLPADFNCIIQTDEYKPYDKLAADFEVPAHAHCWAHVRRRFYQAIEAGEHPARNRWILHQIGLLYQIESRLRKQKAGPALRAVVRTWQSRPILDRLFLVFGKMLQSGKYKPKTITGTAIAYALRQRDGLQVYVDRGQVEIDNNLIENAIRPAALGRKNWLFIGDEDAGWRSAVIYSILQSCKSYGIDPYAYLKDVLERLPQTTIQNIDQLTPGCWAKAQSIKRAS
jgi:transposase/IS1 family transposase